MISCTEGHEQIIYVRGYCPLCSKIIEIQQLTDRAAAAEQHAQAHFVAWKIEGMEEIKKAILSTPLKPHVCSSCSLFDEERTELEAQRDHSDTIAKHIDSMIDAARKPGAGQ